MASLCRLVREIAVVALHHVLGHDHLLVRRALADAEPVHVVENLHRVSRGGRCFSGLRPCSRPGLDASSTNGLDGAGAARSARLGSQQRANARLRHHDGELDIYISNGSRPFSSTRAAARHSDKENMWRLCILACIEIHLPALPENCGAVAQRRRKRGAAQRRRQLSSVTCSSLRWRGR